MSFRKKHREARETRAKEDDMKVAHAKDSQTGKSEKPSAAEQSTDSPQEQRRTEQTTGQQSDQESGQPPEQDSEEETDEQQSSDDEEEDSEPVPDGTTAEILRWVGDDQGRARRALDKEQANDRPRAGLTGELKKILGQ